MMLTANCAHLPTDTDRDHTLSDWQALDRFVDEVLAEVPATAS